MSRRTCAIGAALLLGFPAPPLDCATPTLSELQDVAKLPGPGQRIPLDADTYFTFGWAKPPKLGTAILRVEIFRRDGTRDLGYVVTGDADMPSMRGAHSTGDKPFAVSNKGVYLLPISLVMPGDWEVRLTFQKAGRVVRRGVYCFDL